MIVTLLLAALWIIGAVFSYVLLTTARKHGELRPKAEAIALGAVTNFFDTLGIGSFAPTTAWLKLRRMVPDSFIPAILNAGHCLPTIVQGLIFIKLVNVDPVLLLACISAAVVGSLVGAPLVVRAHVRVVQAVVGVALLIAACLFALTNLGLMPGGGTALSLAPGPLAIAVGVHFVLGALMTFGIGLYAPSLMTVSLLGLNPIAAFPIMMGSCAFLMPVCGMRFLKADRIDRRVVIGLALGGIPLVLIAAFLVKSLSLENLRWGVVVVVLYTAILLLRSAFKGNTVAVGESA
jgi:uncharacterized membrane protein YfcA